ncbi:MAG: hypothetical protein LQ337_004091 [Flavoplaca oasis]|nr:MAG: hypothetical protein LQ337_004091 [Flavoplaca oasis]
MPSLDDLQEQSMRINKTSKFLDKIELHFAQTPNVYNRFLDILDAFKTQKIDALRAIERVSDLFAAHEDLLLEFHALSEYQSGHLQADNLSQESAAASDRGQTVPNEALQFLHRLATRHIHDISLFQRFLDTMQDFTKGMLDTSSLQSRVADLLAHDADLLTEFHTYLPLERESVDAANFDLASERGFKGEWWAI